MTTIVLAALYGIASWPFHAGSCSNIREEGGFEPNLLKFPVCSRIPLHCKRYYELPLHANFLEQENACTITTNDLPFQTQSPDYPLHGS